MVPLWSAVAVVAVALCGHIASLTASADVDKRTTDILYGHYGSGSHCEVNGQLMPHGHVFSEPSMSRCLQHKCLFGTTFIYSEGCEDNSDGCHGVGKVWEERCVTYTCTKTTSGGYNYFQSIIQNIKCRDVYGECHEPGQFFQYRLHGRLHQNCRCNVTENRIHYRCY